MLVSLSCRTMHGFLLTAVLALVALAACGGSDEDAADTGTAPAGETTVVETTGETTEETTTEEEEGPTTIRIAYESGEVRGDTGTVRIDRGAQVRLIVRADIEDEVHLHGYDLTAEVAPGHPARINFEADDAGKFIVELEHLHLHIVTLRVR
jgi:hypothetical protein